MSSSRRSAAASEAGSTFSQYMQHDAAPQMTGAERLQHIRNAIVRLKYILEKARHSEHLDRLDDVSAFFDKIRNRVDSFEYNQKHTGNVAAGGPQHLDWLLKEVKKYIGKAEGLLEIAKNDEMEEDEAPCTYARLSFNYLREILDELREMENVLENKSLPSRVDIQLLKDQVSFHIDDYDLFTNTRLPQFISELVKEGASYSGLVTESDSTPAGLVSAQLLDVVVGVRPARVAAITLRHFESKIQIIRGRLADATAVLTNALVRDPEEQIRRDRQKREYAVMSGRVEDAQQALERLRALWSNDEDTFLARALTPGANLKQLADAKHLKESTIAEEAARHHDDLVYRCLPFMSPQYHRRYQLTYSNPCHIRIGLRFFDPVTQTFQWIPNLSPDYFKLLGQHPNADPLGPIDYLMPFASQIWNPFDDMPEMVMSRRCSLWNVDHRADHERSMEEHKEVGAYFLMKGGERILRALVMQRCNAPINIHRDKFTSQGPHFTPRAVVMRCKRTSGITAQNYFYYTSVGEILFSFARKVVWHIPLALLLHCTKPSLSDTSLFQHLTIGFDGSPEHAARVEALLQHHRKSAYGELNHFIDYLSVLGRMYRSYQQNSNVFHFVPDLHKHLQCHHDAWYGLFVMRRHVLPHLTEDVQTPDLPVNTSDFSSWPGPQIVAELERKFETLVAIARQLYSFTDGQSTHQGNDVPAYQEIFTSSQVLIGAFEVCLNKYMRMFAYRIGTHLTGHLFRGVLKLRRQFDGSTAENCLMQLRKHCEYSTTRQGDNALSTLHRLLVTGNFALDREEDFYCPQNTGWVVMAEHLNFFRFFEQLKCLHRGKTIAEMRSSEVRKYPCEAYGFICMVHSPDGADCGVLNHMSLGTIVSSSMSPKDWGTLNGMLKKAMPRMMDYETTSVADRFLDSVPVWVEGCVVGYARSSEAASAAFELRQIKAIRDAESVTRTGLVYRKKVTALNSLEIVYVPRGSKDPHGLYIFAENGRLMRPVCELEGASTSSKSLPFPLVFIGTWEQSWLDIASVPSDLADAHRQLGKKYQYTEQNGSNLISFTSTTIPFFEYNCSPRNLFQCGLSKQSAGTQLEALAWRKEAKLFRMYTPQRYIVRTLPMDYFGLDDVSLGVNATIAIVAYTGYDMDDAVIVNRTAAQRGFLNAGVTISKVIHAAGKDAGGRDDDGVMVFHNQIGGGARHCLELDDRGLPPKRNAVGNLSMARDSSYPAVLDDTPVYCCARRFKRLDPVTGKSHFEYTRHHITKWKHFDKGEAAWVHSVIPLTYDGPDVTTALVVFRIPRPPTVGDKFSSRHGQKGTLPLHVPAIDLPYSTTSGITPDVLINPHAFPSRMTVGMVLEMIAAKAGAVEGRFMDFSAWNIVDEKPRAAHDLGNILANNGFHRHGRESFVCGISGVEMEADIFTGISGYQRLRHMVNDKWQSRARTDAHTHRAVTKTGQPVKGRKRHGGVRIGEMERDGLLSHGISEVVLDRLLHVSDKTKAFICTECGCLLGVYERHTTKFSSWKSCRFCAAGMDEASDTIKLIDIPQVFRLWVTELASVGVRVTLTVK